MENKKVDFDELAVKIGSVIGVLGATNFTIGDTPISAIPGMLTTMVTATISAHALPMGISAIGLGGLYGCYRVLTKHSREIKEKRKEFCEFFEGLGLRNKNDEIPQLVNIWETENGHMYSFINPIGLSSKTYEDRDIAIKEYFKCNKVLFESNGDFINIQTIETELPTIVPFILPKKKSDDLIVELGVNELGKKIEINFSKTHSWLIARSNWVWQVSLYT